VAVRQASPDDVDEWLVMVEIDKGDVRSPFADEVTTLAGFRRTSSVVITVLKGQNDEISKRLVHHDQGSG
jgi:hypothetical protein